MRIETPTAVFSPSRDRCQKGDLCRESEPLVSSLYSVRILFRPAKKIWTLVQKIFHFLASLFSSPLNSSSYFVVADSNGGTRRVFTGDEDPALIFGASKAQLRETTLASEDLYSALEAFMEKERVDQISICAVNIRLAKRVWECGFSTATCFEFDPQKSGCSFSIALVDLLKKSFKNGDVRDKQKLLAVQRECVLSIISNELSVNSSNIDAKKVKEKINALGHLIECDIDLGNLSDSEENRSIKEMMSSIEKATAAARNSQIGPISLSFASLFSLISVGRPADFPTPPSNFPEIIFTKPKESACE